jgi:hypothetical protein
MAILALGSAPGAGDDARTDPLRVVADGDRGQRLRRRVTPGPTRLVRRKRPRHGSIGAGRCRYPPRDTPPEHPPPHAGHGGRRQDDGAGSGSGRPPVSALPAGDPGPEVLVPHWLTSAHRDRLAAVVRAALSGRRVHPLAAFHLEDVLTELHVAAARDAVWPASAARVRLATGWGEDVLPVRLSAAELDAVLALPDLPGALRGLLSGGVDA